MLQTKCSAAMAATMSSHHAQDPSIVWEVWLWSHEMSVQAYTSINDCSGDEGLSLPWQQKHGVSLLCCVCVCMIVFHYSLRNNQLTDTGAIALAIALQHNKSLEELK